YTSLIRSKGGSLAYLPQYALGKPDKGSDFDMCDNYANARKNGDKIRSFTTYSGGEQIKGIQIGYLHSGEESVGSTSGNRHHKELGNNEYIHGYRFYKKRDGNISRIMLHLRDT